MNNAFSLLVGCMGLAGLWLVYGACGAIRDALAERAKNWLLPTSQPVTFRLARGIARLARRLAPRKRLVCDPTEVALPDHEDTGAANGGVWVDLDWTAPEAALAEFDEDLFSEQRAIDPVRCAIPLIGQALAFRVDNGVARLRRLARSSRAVPVGPVVTATRTRCFLVDDHAVVQQGVNQMFGKHDDLELVGMAGSAEEALGAIAELDPEVVLMDVRLPGIDGISAVRQLRAAAPNLNVVMFSAYGDKRLLSDALAAGASGYVMKGSPPDDLLHAIRAVSLGKPFVDPSLSPALLIGDTGAAARALNEREGKILQLLAEGFHTEEVARRIGVPVEAVESDARRMIAKLQADSRTHAMAIALRRSLID